MRFTLEIDCNNAAFGDGADEVLDEVKRILLGAAYNCDLLNEGETLNLFDSNGNKVGKMIIVNEA
jgi:hypothetical protein